LRCLTYDFSDCSIIVTGSTRGIGWEIARELMIFGARVGVTGRDSDRLAQITLEAEKNGWKCSTCRADMRKAEDIAAMTDQFAREFGRIDGLVNNAGMNIMQSIGSLTPEAIQEVVQVNLLAPMLVTNAVVPYMKRQRGGSIVNIASLSSVTGFYEHAAYCASKEGLLGFTNATASELGRYGIRINSVGPTVVLTELGKEIWDADKQKRERMKSFIPLGRFVKPEEVASTVLFLLSDGASMISGDFILIDGGYMSGKGI